MVFQISDLAQGMKFFFASPRRNLHSIQEQQMTDISPFPLACQMPALTTLGNKLCPGQPILGQQRGISCTAKLMEAALDQAHLSGRIACVVQCSWPLLPAGEGCKCFLLALGFPAASRDGLQWLDMGFGGGESCSCITHQLASGSYVLDKGTEVFHWGTHWSLAVLHARGGFLCQVWFHTFTLSSLLSPLQPCFCSQAFSRAWRTGCVLELSGFGCRCQDASNKKNYLVAHSKQIKTALLNTVHS